MKLLIVFIGYVGVISASVLQEWTDYKLKYHKTYLGNIDLSQRINYIVNKNLILAHNRRFDRKLVKYKLGIGEFTDLSTIQYNEMLGGVRYSLTQPIYPTTTVMPTTTSSPELPTFAPPIYRNWTQDGGITKVKNEGIMCNAAWASAAIDALEGHYFFVNTKLPPILSVQNILDCSGAKQPCSGDQTPDIAYDYIINTQNVNTESAYIYTGFPETCKYNQNNVGTTLGSYERIRENDDEHLFQVVAFEGPVVVGFNPFSFQFQHYKSGIFEPPIKMNTNRYFMTVVGYGHDTTLNSDYWILKNSMGVNWGDRGYIRVIRNAKNPIAKSSIFPNV